MNMAQKYASAFLNCYGGKCTREGIVNIGRAALFLRTHRRALFLLQVPLIDQTIKYNGLHDLAERFFLPEPVDQLIRTLLKNKRAYLLAAIFQAIVHQYNSNHDIYTFVITSSSELSSAYEREIEQFIDRHVAGTKEYHYKIDPALIAGVRIQSDTILWEFSIDKQLRDLKHARS